jgi:hypothetical protein
LRPKPPRESLRDKALPRSSPVDVDKEPHHHILVIQLKTWLPAAMAAFFLLQAPVVLAVTFKSGAFDLGINAYLDFEQTYMSSMPNPIPCSPQSPCAVGDKSLVSGQAYSHHHHMLEWDQNHLNLIMDGRLNQTRAHINFESRHAFSTYDGDTGASGRPGDGTRTNVGSFRVAEAYGDHQFSEKLGFRAGLFYSPYGIYNEVRYATPLFATVVLPFIYEVHTEYSGTILAPSNSNLMLYGNTASPAVTWRYNLYLSAGQRNNNDARPEDHGKGQETNANKGVGFRLRSGFGEDRYHLGVSAYHEVISGTGSTLLAGDLELLMPKAFHLQAEYATQHNPNGLRTGFSKNGYYTRLMYEAGRCTPAVIFDVFKDDNDTLYKHTNRRIGAGIGYEVTRNFYLKTEYHYHWFDAMPVTTGTTATGEAVETMAHNSVTHMWKTSVIFYF